MTQKLIALVFFLGLITALSYATGLQSRQAFGAPLIWSLNAYCIVVQILIYIPSAVFKTQKFYDLTGSFTYLSTMAIALATNKNINFIQGIAGGMIGIWALRLGIYLFKRVIQKGSDSRFFETKKNPFDFFVAWVFQGFWTVLTPCPLIVILTKNIQYSSLRTVNIVSLVGFCIWLFGFIVQCVSDYQKSNFNSNPENKGRFINIGLWSISRHPNYAGEIVIWLGAAIFAVPNLSDWQFFSLISPIFVYILLSKISGVPLLEQYAQKKWGKQEAYIQYKRETAELFPYPCRKQEQINPMLQ